MIPKRLASISLRDVDQLITDQVREGSTVDYKQELPATGRAQDRNEFLYDVSAFANAAGGDLVYGVEENRDDKGRATGLPKAVTGLQGVNRDEEERRLRAMLHSGLDPIIPGVELRFIDGEDSSRPPVLIVRVPQSWAGPHMVGVDHLSKFFVRVGAMRQQLDREGIRRAFMVPEFGRQRVGRFRDDRLSRILANEGVLPLKPGWRCVVHIVPRQAADGTGRIDLASAADILISKGQRVFTGSKFYNIDGIAFGLISGETEGHERCAQLFRDGSIEAVLAPEPGNRPFMAFWLEQFCRNTLEESLVMYRELEIAPPLSVMMALLGVKGLTLAAGELHVRRNREARPFTRDNLILPDVSIEAIDADPATALRPLFDVLWQSAGYEKSFE